MTEKKKLKNQQQLYFLVKDVTIEFLYGNITLIENEF